MRDAVVALETDIDGIAGFGQALGVGLPLAGAEFVHLPHGDAAEPGEPAGFVALDASGKPEAGVGDGEQAGPVVEDVYRRQRAEMARRGGHLQPAGEFERAEALLVVADAEILDRPRGHRHRDQVRLGPRGACP